MKNKEVNIHRIEAQVERWDLFARLVPTVFLIINLILVTTGIINFEQAFWVGLGLFALTAVTWWFWTIYTIRHLVKTLTVAATSLKEVRDEFKAIHQDIEEFRNDQ